MHDDSHGPSLSNELKLCRNTIQRIKKTLELLERKHNMSTVQFIEDLSRGEIQLDPSDEEDVVVWQSSYESLKTWESLEREYLLVNVKLKRT